MSDVSPKPVMSREASLRRFVTKLSFKQIHKAWHGEQVARAMLDEIRHACAKAVAQNLALNPQSLMAFIDDNQSQFDPDTARGEEE